MLKNRLQNGTATGDDYMKASRSWRVSLRALVAADPQTPASVISDMTGRTWGFFAHKRQVFEALMSREDLTLRDAEALLRGAINFRKVHQSVAILKAKPEIAGVFAQLYEQDAMVRSKSLEDRQAQGKYLNDLASTPDLPAAVYQQVLQLAHNAPIRSLDSRVSRQLYHNPSSPIRSPEDVALTLSGVGRFRETVNAGVKKQRSAKVTTEASAANDIDKRINEGLDRIRRMGLKDPKAKALAPAVDELDRRLQSAEELTATLMEHHEVDAPQRTHEALLKAEEDTAKLVKLAGKLLIGAFSDQTERTLKIVINQAEAALDGYESVVEALIELTEVSTDGQTKQFAEKFDLMRSRIQAWSELEAAQSVTLHELTLRKGSAPRSDGGLRA